MPLREQGGIRRPLLAVLAAAGAIAFVAPAAGAAAEPNGTPATASGPLTAGATFRAALDSPDDVDWQYFYIPDPATVTVTLANAAEPGGENANRGRTITMGIVQARKGKPFRTITGSGARVRPGKQKQVEVALVPGKYLLPVLHAKTSANPLGNVPFRLTIRPPGTTTDSHEIFARRCASAIQRVKRMHRSKVKLAKRVKKARRKDKEAKEERLEDRLDAKKARIKVARRNKRITCSVPR